MKVVKCINNNVAICLDDDNNELVAFGKGIGFKKPPFEIDVAVIQKTYYGIDENYVHMINEIPEEILLLSEEIIKYAENELDYIFSPNVIFTLADHINFAIVRYKERLNITLPIVQDIKFLYENEYAIGKYALSLIEKRLNIKLDLCKDGNLIVDKKEFTKVVENLLTNAIKFTKGDKRIVIKTYVKDEYFYYDVYNSGDNINESDLKNIFNSYYKDKSTRNKNILLKILVVHLAPIDDFFNIGKIRNVAVR